MRKHSLVPHPDTPPMAVSGIDVALRMTNEEHVLFSFTVHGSEALIVPEQRTPGRADGLWSTTCFECFLRPNGGPGYQEYNFAPSGRWAAYAFDRYRQGMRALALAVDPWVGPGDDAGRGSYVCDADLDLSHLPPGPVQLGLSAVIEEAGGRKSYWALVHPPGAPDFHHPDCFAAELGAPAKP